MNITIVTPTPTLDGGIRVIAIHAAGLQRMGHQVQIVHPPAPEPTMRQKMLAAVMPSRGRLNQQSASHFDRLNVARLVLPSSRIRTPAHFPTSDVIVATWWETAEWVAALPASKGAKAYFVQGHEVFDYLPKERVRATYRLPLHKITISRWLMGLMATEYGDHDVTLAPNGVDLTQFRATDRRKSGPPTVGMIYSREHFKGSDLCIRAATLAREKVPDLRLLAFGLPERPVALPEWAEYHVRPPQAMIPRLYAECDAWLFGSRSEGFGLPLLEAMACGTPVIATPAGAAPELVCDQRGFLVPFDDAKSMSRAITDICSVNEATWEKLSRAARLMAEQHSWERSTKAFEGGLNYALRKHGSEYVRVE